MFFQLTACNSGHDIKRIYVEPWEQQLGYAQIVKHNKILYLSGVTASGGDMTMQIDVIYSKINVLLKKEGLDFSNVVKETIFTTDMNALKNNIAVRNKYFNNNEYPSSSWIEVKGLFMPDMKLEVEMEVAL